MFDFLRNLFPGMGAGGTPSPQLLFDPADGGSINPLPQGFLGRPMDPPQLEASQPQMAPPPLPPQRPGVGVLNSIADQQPKLPGVMDAGTPNPMQAGPLMAYLKQQYGGFA